MNARCRTIVTAAVLSALACGAAGEARAQAMDPEAERARQLVLRIRRSMKEIDALLLGGAAPEKIEGELAANQKRLQQLLDDAESKSGAVMQQLDELIEMSKSEESDQKSPSDGESGEPPKKSGQGQQGKPPERERSQDPQELQQQPESQDQPGGQKPEPKGQEEKQPADGDPNKGGPDPNKGEQRDAKGDPPLGATGEFERTDLSGRWGMLPDKEAELLQRRSVEEFPQRYRVWMEQYFRRVSRLPARD